MNQLLLLNPENASEHEVKDYFRREAVRAVVTDQDGNFALVHSFKNNHYKIPGGGIKKGENRKLALNRECLEEIGCNIEIVGEIGKIIEYRKVYKLVQISYCYLAKVVGNKGKPKYEKDEIEDGFKPVWVSYEKALNLFKETGPTLEAKYYMVPRDSYFLKKAIKFINKLI